ncbi:transposable element Tcb1 transposase [Trichonephila clavipes]|nr:transposable element Tcb1 transposase [Trichonephila clavipes]
MKEGQANCAKAGMDRSVTSRTTALHIESVTYYSVSALSIRLRLHQSGLSARRPLLGLSLTQSHRRLTANGALKEGFGWQNGMKLSLLTSHASVCNTTMVGLQSAQTVGRGGLTAALCTTTFVLLRGLATAIFQQDNSRPHVARIVQMFFVNHLIALLPWLACTLDLSPIENMWPMVSQRLTQITHPAATPDQLCQCVEASWSGQEHIQSLFESMPKRVVALSSNNGGYSVY